MTTKTLPFIDGTGEYGATVVSVVRDGSATRIAFGRNQISNSESASPIYYLGVLLTEEARASLIAQLTATDVAE